MLQIPRTALIPNGHYYVLVKQTDAQVVEEPTAASSTGGALCVTNEWALRRGLTGHQLPLTHDNADLPPSGVPLNYWENSHFVLIRRGKGMAMPMLRMGVNQSPPVKPPVIVADSTLLDWEEEGGIVQSQGRTIGCILGGSGQTYQMLENIAWEILDISEAHWQDLGTPKAVRVEFIPMEFVRHDFSEYSRAQHEAFNRFHPDCEIIIIRMPTLADFGRMYVQETNGQFFKSHGVHLTKYARSWLRLAMSKWACYHGLSLILCIGWHSHTATLDTEFASQARLIRSLWNRCMASTSGLGTASSHGL